MNSALDKVGVYDFFGVLLSGMIVIVVSCCLDLPLINLIANDTLIPVVFFSLWIITGIIICIRSLRE